MPALSSIGSLCIPEHPWAGAGGTAGGPLRLQEGAGASPPPWVASSALLDQQPGGVRMDGAVETRDHDVPPCCAALRAGTELSPRVGICKCPRGDATLRAPGVRAGQGGGSGYLDMYFFCFHSTAYIFPSFNLFCLNSQVKNSFHEPELATATLRPAVGAGDRPGTVALHPSSGCSNTDARGLG